jgi:hypothetical protein
MCENTCHMTECIIRDRIAPGRPRNSDSRTFNTLNLDNPIRGLVSQPVNNWTRFTQSESANWDPLLVAPGQSQAGLSHFPPAAMHNYNWHTVRYDFGNLEDFRVFDGAWSATGGEYHAEAGDAVKALAFDRMTLNDNLGDYHPPVAFSDAEVELSVRFPAGNPDSHGGFLFRVGEARTGPNRLKGYYVGLSEARDRVVAARLDNAYVPLAETPHPVETARPQRLRIEAHGSSIKVFLDGALAPSLAIIDDRYRTGGFGLTAYATEAWFSDLRIVAHTRNQADQWYAYPRRTDASRVISPLEWDGDQDVAMDHFYAW